MDEKASYEVLSMMKYLQESEDAEKYSRSSSEEMLKPYDAYAEPSRQMRKLAKLMGYDVSPYAVAYPCYRNAMGGSSYVYYDAGSGRCFELFIPNDKHEWRMRIGEKMAEDNVSSRTDARTYASTLRMESTNIYRLWLYCAVEDQRRKILHVTANTVGATATSAYVINTIVKAIGQIRKWRDVASAHGTTYSITDLEGTSRTVAPGMTGAKNDPSVSGAFERAVGARGFAEWYKKHIGVAAESGTRGAEGKKQYAMSNASVAQIIKNMGLANPETTKIFNNDELLRIFNAIIQENPYVSYGVKKRWREILKRLYEKYGILKTEGIDDSNEEFFGPELYDENIKNAINNKEIRMSMRIDLWKLLTNTILKHEGLGSPDSKRNTERYSKNVDPDYAPERIITTKSKRSGYFESIVPDFMSFVNEADQTIRTYTVKFDGHADKEVLTSTAGVVDAKMLADDEWEITGFGSFIDGVREMKTSGVGPGVKDARLKLNDENGNVVRDAYRDAHKKVMMPKYGTGAAEHEYKEQIKRMADKLVGGRYFKSGDGTLITEVIFDAADVIGGYIRVRYSSNKGKYYGEICPDPEHVGKYVSKRLYGEFVIKVGDKYIAHGGAAKTGDVEYYAETDIKNGNVLIFGDKESADDFVKKYGNDTDGKFEVVSHGDALADKYDELYDSARAKYDSMRGNAFYIDPEDAENARESGIATARSIEDMPAAARRSFINATDAAFKEEKIINAAQRTIGKMARAAVKAKAYAGEYAGAIDAAKAAEIKKYGNDVDVAYSESPTDFLRVTAELIDSLYDIADEKTINSLIDSWYANAGAVLDLAGMVFSYGGRSIEKLAEARVRPSETLPEIIKKTAAARITEENKVRYVVTIAFLQMLVREIGAAYVMSGGQGAGGQKASAQSKIADDSQESDIARIQILSDIRGVPLANAWEKSNEFINNLKDKGMSDANITKIRSKLINLSLDAMNSVGDDTSNAEYVEPEWPIDEDTAKEMAASMTKVPPKLAALYRARLMAIMADAQKTAAQNQGQK